MRDFSNDHVELKQANERLAMHRHNPNSERPSWLWPLMLAIGLALFAGCKGEPQQPKRLNMRANGDCCDYPSAYRWLRREFVELYHEHAKCESLQEAYLELHTEYVRVAGADTPPMHATCIDCGKWIRADGQPCRWCAERTRGP